MRSRFRRAISNSRSRPQHQPQQQPYPQPNQGATHAAPPDVGGLPAFITGGGQPQPNVSPNAADGPNGHDQGDRNDRFGRRRRRHRGGSNFRPERPDNFGNTQPQGAAPAVPHDGGDEPPRQPDLSRFFTGSAKPRNAGIPDSIADSGFAAFGDRADDVARRAAG